MRGLIRYTVTELFDRKLLWAFVILTVISVVLVFYTSSIEINFGGGGQELSELGEPMGASILKGLSSFLSFLVFLAVMGTAGLIPALLSRGRADYFLSKPISRSLLFTYKFLSIFLVYAGVVAICGAAVWIAMGLSYVGFSWSVLYLFLFHILSLFVWLTITAFAGVVSGSFAMSIIAAFLVWVAHSVVSTARMFEDVLGSQTLKQLLDVIYYVLPKNSEFIKLGERLASGQFAAGYASLWSSLVFAIVLVFISLVIFNRKNY